MKRKLTFFCLAVLISMQTGWAQELSPKDSLLLQRTMPRVERNLADKIKDHNYAVFSLGGNLILVMVEQSQAIYDEYLIANDSLVKSREVSVDSNDLLTPQLFRKATYQRDRNLFSRIEGLNPLVPIYFAFGDRSGEIVERKFANYSDFSMYAGGDLCYMLYLKVLFNSPKGVILKGSIKEAKRILKENRKALNQYNKATKPVIRDSKKRRAKYKRECDRDYRELMREERQERRALKQAQKSR